MRFTLTIEMGNDAMSNTNHVADALVKVRDAIWKLNEEAFAGSSGRVRDYNGNVVGRWEFVED